MGKLAAIILAGALAGFFLYGNDPRVSAACNAVAGQAQSAATHAKGLADQVQHDVQGIQKTCRSLGGQEQRQDNSQRR